MLPQFPLSSSETRNCKGWVGKFNDKFEQKQYNLQILKIILQNVYWVMITMFINIYVMNNFNNQLRNRLFYYSYANIKLCAKKYLMKPLWYWKVP